MPDIWVIFVMFLPNLILMSNEYLALQFPSVNLYQLIQKNKDT